MPHTQRRECEGKHELHDAIMEVYGERHTNDQHSLFIRIDPRYRGNHTPQTFYAEIRDALEHLLCQGWIKPTPSAGYFVLSSCGFYDVRGTVKPPRYKTTRPPVAQTPVASYRGPRLVHSS